ncbi:hypothetical protein P154DRAFT_444837 [Amniculicola lignicola CBS 123094]|uniref:Uncharacterized protein n=1 Tax=Amniculicola lignicola CBS 123094 TaxID=1392246 RepID=A0A6A5W470_9PLEO|nr:hypothetical protein P154DRAFT_444837 [Amniculicola lignicola CBS 123094]
MDFSNDIFRAPSAVPRLSDDTMNHSNLVMACRFGWAAGPEDGTQPTTFATQSPPAQDPLVGFSHDSRTKRFAPCQGRLYHQLSCSHRVRTDIVEECGPNCLDPSTARSTLSFYCHECLENEAMEIWRKWKAELNGLYPPLSQMAKPQSDQWYQQYRQLEAKFANDRAAYKLELQNKTRPSNVCSALEASQEEKAFADELDSLSLAMASSNDNTIVSPNDATSIIQHQPHLDRNNIADDASEQLSWNLNTLALDRGSCGVEYSTNESNGISSTPIFKQEELWRKPRG